MFKNGGSVPETVKHFVLGWTALGGDHGDFERKAWQTLLPGNEPNTEEMKKVRVGGLCPPTHTFSFAPLCLAHSQAAASATPFSQNLRDRHPRPSTQGPCLTVSGTEPPLLNKVVTRTKCVDYGGSRKGVSITVVLGNSVFCLFEEWPTRHVARKGSYEGGKVL